MTDFCDDYSSYNSDSGNLVYSSYFKKNTVVNVIISMSTFRKESDKFRHLNQNISFESIIESAILNNKPLNQYKCRLIFPRKTFYKMLMNYLIPDKSQVFLNYLGDVRIIFHLESPQLYVLESYEFLSG